jgi:probable DNA metabolism protein
VDAAGILFRVSADAYDALVHVWMSGRPLEGEALRYALRVLSAAKKAAAAGPGPWYGREEARRGAMAAARNRLDDDCRTVLAVSYQVAHEIDRFLGFLRFSPDSRGRYVARCAPDYFVLPALAPHFSARFGDTPWVIIDERRGLALIGEGRGEARLAAESGNAESGEAGSWEELWRRYHATISIESRKNPSLQRQFRPLRYRNYLNEFGPPPAGYCN